jgi:cadmium resistance protein CadD (predicted permease)
VSAVVVASLGVALFVSTNLDDIFVLIAFFADPRFRARHVLLGQFAGIAALAFGSFGLALAAARFPAAYVRFLGLLPIALGVRMLVRAFRSREDASEAPPERTGVITVAAVTIANGADNVAAYVPFFAVRRWREALLVLGVFAVMTTIWCGMAFWLVRQPMLGAPLRKWGPVVLPWILVALGVYILASPGW